MPLKVTNTADDSIVHQNNYLAEDLDTKDMIEAKRDLHLPFGDAHFAHWYFEGIRMAYSLWNYRSVQTSEWKSNLDVVTIYFSMKGSITLDAKELGAPFTFSSGQYNLFYTNSFNGFFTNNELVQETFILQFTKQAFRRLAADGGEVMHDFMQKVESGQPIFLSARNLYMDVSLHHAIRQIIECRYHGSVKKMFLYSKCLEIFVSVADALARAQNQTAIYCKTDYDRERILFARDYLLQHLDLPPSLVELSRIAGINEFKLKRGFKEMFDTTVFGYLSEHRLELAKQDILEGKKTATEIAFELGYASPQHFSRAFKQKYGVSPKQAR